MSWLVKVTPHAVRFFGGAVRAFRASGGGRIIVATARKILFRV